jgi:hypothetical protein
MVLAFSAPLVLTLRERNGDAAKTASLHGRGVLAMQLAVFEPMLKRFQIVQVLCLLFMRRFGG